MKNSNSIIRKMKIKTQWDPISYLMGWLKLKGLMGWQGCRSTGTLIHVKAQDDTTSSEKCLVVSYS